MIETIIVTKSPAIVQYIVELGLVSSARVLLLPRAEDVRGKHVIGELPLHLAALAESVTEIPLDIPVSLLGKELSLEQVRKYAEPPVTYTVRRESENVWRFQS